MVDRGLYIGPSLASIPFLLLTKPQYVGIRDSSFHFEIYPEARTVRKNALKKIHGFRLSKNYVNMKDIRKCFYSRQD